ncbi:hypothetical protein BDV59DRAFT_201763 [Aspergillus ambiguus]|uniref:uncharacterized protein n=1 Tax=Aspergillus ambiguus TaxID=176160 RepID=UPI003CCDA041
MADDSVEVPIMFSPSVPLSYEDIAKLNPFYEEYRSFWRTPSDASSSTYDTSRSSSLRTLCTDSDTPNSSLDLSISEMHMHPGNKYNPSYDGAKNRIHSQIAIVEDEYHVPPLAIRKGSSEDDQPGINMLELDLLDNPLTQPRTSHKQLFGSNGWLGCTTDLQNTTSRARNPKRNTIKSLGKKIMQHVEGIAGDMAKAYPRSFAHGAHRAKIVPESPFPISLDPPMQAKLYSELEVMICVSANKFLVHQYRAGRVSEDSIRKVTSFWESKNRPQVVEFQFDQATQRQLILSNIRTLQFNGECSTNPVLLHSNLRNWRAVVKEMNVRTFCAPDSVIRKHMHDIHKLLDMLGAPVSTFLEFEELQMRTLAVMKRHREKGQHFRGEGPTSAGSSREIK